MSHVHWLRLFSGKDTKGVLKYQMFGKGIVDFYDTYVVENERGKGIGKLLAKVSTHLLFREVFSLPLRELKISFFKLELVKILMLIFVLIIMFRFIR